ncbi:hypothetical protein G5V58_11885 [Nocardioides anomalus]|uniref:Uncharacterized protein n=1 Tax=Nocardioides anomalus TaxID=2712223 RepID=A0A6G6WDQ2_9ACTN|nr:hypothetical protein [Nocardioides anomalus]QIG43372.1 hypothetical protein G5V58_11885 [Nocardioides anomalus]
MALVMPRGRMMAALGAGSSYCGLFPLGLLVAFATLNTFGQTAGRRSAVRTRTIVPMSVRSGV